MQAPFILPQSLFGDLDTVKVVCDLLAAEYVQAVEVIVSSSAVVSRYLEAEYVEAGSSPSASTRSASCVWRSLPICRKKSGV